MHHFYSYTNNKNSCKTIGGLFCFYIIRDPKSNESLLNVLAIKSKNLSLSKIFSFEFPPGSMICSRLHCQICNYCHDLNFLLLSFRFSYHKTINNTVSLDFLSRVAAEISLCLTINIHRCKFLSKKGLTQLKNLFGEDLSTHLNYVTRSQTEGNVNPYMIVSEQNEFNRATYVIHKNYYLELEGQVERTRMVVVVVFVRILELKWGFSRYENNA